MGLGLKDTPQKKGKCAADEVVAYFQVSKGSVIEEERNCSEGNWEGKVHAMFLTGFLR